MLQLYSLITKLELSWSMLLELLKNINVRVFDSPKIVDSLIREARIVMVDVV